MNTVIKNPFHFPGHELSAREFNGPNRLTVTRQYCQLHQSIHPTCTLSVYLYSWDGSNVVSSCWHGRIRTTDRFQMVVTLSWPFWPTSMVAAAPFSTTSTTTKKPRWLGFKAAMWAVPLLGVLLLQGGILNVHHLQGFYLAMIVPTEMQSWAVHAMPNASSTNNSKSTNSHSNGTTTNSSSTAGTTSTFQEDTLSLLPPPSKRRDVNVNISIVVELAGELGNHLFRLAQGYVVQRILWKDYGIPSHLVMQHQPIKKWVKPARDLQNCFLHFGSMDFTLGNSAEFRQRSDQQLEWLGESNSSKLVFSRSTNIHKGLDYLMELLANATPPPALLDSTTPNISLPFLVTRGGANWELVDTYFQDLQHFFAFDETKCCKTLPDPDEHVFHYRNFRTELPAVGKKLGFEEISPNQSVVLLQGATKVAITTRFDNKHTRAYLDTFLQQGWQARIVSGQTGTQDFCFLKHAPTLVAGKRSTYAVWASFLGKAHHVTLYKINTTHTRNKFGEDYATVDPQFHTAELRNRIRFVTLTP